MAEYFQLRDYRKWVTPTGNMGVLISNSTKYYGILRDAFPPSHRFSRTWTDQQNKFEYGFYINDIDKKELPIIISLLDLFKKAVCIEDILSQTFALEMHHRPFYERGGGGKTKIGQLVYDTKYAKISMAERKENAMKLVEHFSNFISSHPSYARSDFLIPTPYFENKSLDISEFVVKHLSVRLNITNGYGLVLKTKKTKPMKDASSEEEKFNIIRGAFKVSDTGQLQGKRVIIIDDIYQSGSTVHELASVLQDAGAEVFGLMATKTLRTFNQDIQK